MTLGTFATYGGICAAAAIEGEVVFIAASVLVAAGKLSAAGVIVAGALGAAAGDQFYFYLLRGRVDGWLRRLRPIAARHAMIVDRVRRHQTVMIFVIRFAPGLRIALAAACAYARVSALRFSLVDTAAAISWAVLLMTLISRAGPALLDDLGVSGIWAALLPAAAVLAFVWWVGHLSKDATRQAEGSV
jgi:membrane protein DedA with SNARE-associated domain